MRILFFQRWVGVREGGTETEIKELSRFLAEKGHKVCILTLAGDALLNFDPRVRIIPLRMGPGESLASYHISDPRLYFYTAFYMLQSLLFLLYLHYVKKLRFDVLSVHFYTEAKVARAFRWLTGTPYVFVLEGYTDREAREAKFANAQLCVSRHDQEQCFRNFGFRPVLKPVGVNQKKFKNQSSKVKIEDIKKRYTKGGEFLCLTVARLEPRKDLSTLLDAAKIVKAKDPRIKFLIVGEGILEKELKEGVRSLDLEDTIFFVGRVSDEDLPRFYQIADLFVLPTLYEGFGIVFLEAMASGLPILSTKVGAVPEVVGDCGVLIKPKDPKLLAEEIIRLLSDEEERVKLIKCGLERVKREYDQQKLLKIYEDTCLKLKK